MEGRTHYVIPAVGPTRPTKVFVRIPGERARYLITDVSALLVDCDQCKAPRGSPCFSRHTNDGYQTSTHYVRRNAAKWVNSQDRARFLNSAYYVPGTEEPTDTPYPTLDIDSDI